MLPGLNTNLIIHIADIWKQEFLNNENLIEKLKLESSLESFLTNDHVLNLNIVKTKECLETIINNFDRIPSTLEM